METLVTLHALLDRRRRWQLVMVAGMMALTALIEMATISAAMPFLSIVASAQTTAGRHGRSALIDVFRPDIVPEFGGDPIAVAASILALVIVLAAIARLTMSWLLQRFAAAVGHDLTMRIWQRMLHQSYAAYLARNTSEVLGGLEKVRPAVVNVIQPAMQGLGSAVIAILLGSLVFVIARSAAVIVALSAAAIYIGTSVLMSRRLHRNSIISARAIGARTKLVQEGLGSFRDILLARSQPVFEDRLRTIDAEQHRAAVSNALITATPRFLAEATAVAAMVVVTLIATRQPGGFLAAIPTLGALALGGQRLLPLFQQVYASWSQASGNIHLLSDVLVLAGGTGQAASPPTLPRPGWSGEIRFDGVGFAYRDGTAVLQDVHLAIRQGERIGLVGRSGSGKSTLLDLLMGLLEPIRGTISIDGTPLDDANRGGWQTQLAHVPQAIYLLDDSIAANIALAVEPDKIDPARLARAAASAHLGPLIDELPLRMSTVVAERGVRLSGGQRQRIGIARALYYAPALLVLDEATSALDDEAEESILASIVADYPDMTIVIVAHRASSLALCDRILTLVDGRVVESATPPGAGIERR